MNNKIITLLLGLAFSIVPIVNPIYEVTIKADAAGITLTEPQSWEDLVERLLIKNSWNSNSLLESSEEMSIPYHRDIYYVNVQFFGARGDGQTDDTAAIQKAINWVYSKGGGTVYIPDGTYLVNPDVSIRLKSNIRLYLSDNAIIQALPSANSYYDIILVLNANNVQIIGGQIIGERYTHSGTTGEWGSGISILGSNDVHVSDISICDCWGDGIFIGPSWHGTPNYQNYSENIIVERFYVSNNRRQGISVISAKNLIIRDGEASYSNGTSPQSGIDLEPNYSTEYLQNILIENVVTRHNENIGIMVSLPAYHGSSNELSVTIKNHYDVGSPFPLTFYKYFESENCKISIHGVDPRSITSYY